MLKVKNKISRFLFALWMYFSKHKMLLSYEKGLFAVVVISSFFISITAVCLDVSYVFVFIVLEFLFLFGVWLVMLLISWYRVESSQIAAQISIASFIPSGKILPPMRGWAASPDFVYLLITQIQEKKISTVLELGSGFSTIMVAHTLRSMGGGHIYSFDHDKIYAGKTRALLHEYGLTEYATVVDSPLETYDLDGFTGDWYGLKEFQSLDENITAELLIVDGPPCFGGSRARYPALPVLREYLSPDALVILDDTDRLDEQIIIKKWLTLYPEYKSDYIPLEKGACVLTVK